MIVTSGGLTWTPHPNPAIAARVLEIFRAWEGTPYMVGQCAIGEAVDCVHFFYGFCCMAYRREFPVLDRLPQDMSLHNRLGAMKAMHAMRRSFPQHLRVTDGKVYAADIVVTGPFTGGPGHVRFVGPEQNTLWECASMGVIQAGFSFDPRWQHVFRVYRLQNQESWL